MFDGQQQYLVDYSFWKEWANPTSDYKALYLFRFNCFVVPNGHMVLCLELFITGEPEAKREREKPKFSVLRYQSSKHKQKWKTT